jgi:hypothetical protein
MIAKRVPGFLPSVNGLPFANDFEDGPVLTITVPPFGELPVGNAAGGMCGGMVFTVMDMFALRLALPPGTPAPQPGNPLFQYLARRLLDSFNGVRGVYKYLEWMRFPDDSHWFDFFKSIGWHTVNDEWPDIRDDLDSGRLCPLGLVEVESLNPFELGNNHQVLAYGYDLNQQSGDLRILVYDPNNPGDDEVTLALNMAYPNMPSRITFSADPAGRGFFRSRYAPADPRPALPGV